MGAVLYHGTRDEAAAMAILACGEIRPGHLTQGRGHLSPVAGRVYLSPCPRYGAVYALGGDFIGHQMGAGRIAERGRHGYLFACDAADLADPQPDEDSVGEFVTRHTQRVWDTARVPWRYLGLHPKFDEDDDMVLRLSVYRAIQAAMTPRQFAMAADGIISGQASGGRRALKALGRRHKDLLIAWGAHVAHLGPIRPTACWRIDRRRSAEIAKDASNLFEIAEPLRMTMADAPERIAA